MANTYTQIYIHYVFAVQNRWALVDQAWRDPLEKYMAGIVSNLDSKLLQIYCMPDHCHLLIGLHPDVAVSDLIKTVKANASRWVNQQLLAQGHFAWQEGYGAFSVSRSVMPRVAQYFKSQPQHHHTLPLRLEYEKMLARHGIEYDPKYLFQDVYIG